MGPEIVDVIIHRPKPPWPEQVFLVLNGMPELRFERRGDYLLASDGGFYSAYGYERPSSRFKAFGGAEFDIPLVDGTVEHANGQWWDCAYPKIDGVELESPGISTADMLAKCYVFRGGYKVDRRLIDAWLVSNNPSFDYRKYDVGHAMVR